MKGFILSWTFLVLASIVNAQYFSEGWTPGAPVSQTQDATTPAATSVPPKQTQERISPSTILKMMDLNYLITSPPSVAIFSHFGINITEKWAGALAKINTWDTRVPLITDENYKDLIVNEPLSGREEVDRVWAIVISIPGAQDGLQKYTDEVFDGAFNTSLINGDLPHVRWGRIDYLNVTTLTTKWNVWNAPYLVLARNRGTELRFYSPRYLRLTEDAFRTFLINEDWKYTDPWKSSYGPGGSNEWIMDYFALGMTKLYEIMTLLPRWAMFLISGSLASVIINYFHKSSAAADAPRRQVTQPPPSTSTNDEKDEKKESTEPQPKASGVNLPQTTKRKKANTKGSSR